jgi:hypothetical protein
MDLMKVFSKTVSRTDSKTDPELPENRYSESLTDPHP